MISISKFAVGIGLATVMTLAALPADAGCKRMQFLVNDYGKDGPTKDSQDLLDKHIAQWAAEQGIEKFTVGKKDTTCELFLNFILFDEHTCTTRATVCWGGDKQPGEQASKAPKKPGAEKDAKIEPAKADAAAKPADALADAVTKPAGADTTPLAEGASSGAPASAPPPAEAAAAGASPAETKATEPAKTANSAVETGTIPLSNKPAETAPAAAAADPAIDVTQRDAVAAATAAAERAAAAAERAAAAAERAAAALNERIAADNERADQKPTFAPPNAALVAPVQPTTKQ